MAKKVNNVLRGRSIFMGGGWVRFECTEIRGGQNFSACKTRGAKFQCTEVEGEAKFQCMKVNALLPNNRHFATKIVKKFPSGGVNITYC